MQSPAPDTIREARHNAGLTQPQAAKVVGVHWTTWQRWELGTRKMPQSAWELFGLKAPPKPR